MPTENMNLITDPKRLAALRETALLDSPTEEAFDRFTRLAAQLLGTPVALVSLIDTNRQYFKSAVGLPEPWATTRETPLSHSFCKHTVTTGRPLIIPDVRNHPLVRQNLAIGDLGVVAYAGIPLKTTNGDTLGSFCAIDIKPHQWTREETAALTDLASMVMNEIELRTTLREVKRLSKVGDSLAAEKNALLDAVGIGIYGIDRNHNCIYINPIGAALLGYKPEELIGQNMHKAVHHTRPDGTPHPQQACPIEGALRTGKWFENESDTFFKKSGKTLRARYTVTPVVVAGYVERAVIVFSDTAKQHEREQLRADLSRTMIDSFRMPITDIQAAIHVLSCDARPEQKHEIAALRKSASTLQDTLDNFDYINHVKYERKA